MPPPAIALPLETVCDGTAPGARGVPRARLSVRVELRTVKLEKSLMPPPCPEPKLIDAVTAGCTDGCVAAERAARDGHGRTNDGRIAERTAARTGAGAAAERLVPGKRAVTDRGRAGTDERNVDGTAQCEDVAGMTEWDLLGPMAMALLASKVLLVTVSAPDELSSMPPPNPPGPCQQLPRASLSVSVQLLRLRAALPSSRMPPPVVARPSVMVSPAMVTLALPLMSKIAAGVVAADGQLVRPRAVDRHAVADRQFAAASA